MFSRKLASVPLKSDPTVRRSFLSPDELLTRPAGDEIKVIGDLFKYTAKEFGNRTACYYRDVVKIVEETKQVQKPDGTMEDKQWKYFTLSDPKPVSHTQMNDRINALASGLISIGFTNPFTPVSERQRVSIYADTSLRWQLMSQALARLGHVITTAYTTLGTEGLLTSLVEPGVELVFVGEAQVGTLAAVLERTEKVKYVVFEAGGETAKVDEITKILEARGGRAVMLDELESVGKSTTVDFGPGPEETDLFCIMYTSGSTGAPKGVLLTHKNIISSIAGSTKLWGPSFYPKSDMLLAFLPLAHILEQFLESTFYFLGVPLAYGSVKTLLDDSVRGCKGDFAAFKPTLLAAVPAIYEMIRKGMVKKINEAGPVVGTVFNMAVKGKQTLPWPLSTVIDRVLFARVKQATGGRLRLAVCGGGALSRHTQEFLTTVLAPVMQGYGLTETCGMTTITTIHYWQLGAVGVLGPSCEVKLADYPEAGYLSFNDPPQGEIWIRGPTVFQGYFNNDALTKESFTPDGWFKSGDIGQWNSDGTLSIIDRVKNLIKLQNGEYLALDRVESIYKASNVVMMLCLVAPPGADRPVALVYPHEGNLRALLKQTNPEFADQSPAQWSKEASIAKIVEAQLVQTGKAAALQKAEMIKGVILTDEEWSPDNGMLTAAMKLARPFISNKHASQIEAAYKED